jgi:hypothetical protein
VEGEPDGIEGVAAPVPFGVARRVGVLHRDPIREGGKIGGPLGRGQRGGEGRAGTSRVRVGAQPVLQGHRVRGQVVHMGAGALVGVGHRAAALEAPLPRSADRAVHAPGARRRGRDDARPVAIPRRRDLHHERDVAPAAGSVSPGERQILRARDLALTEGVVAGHVDVGPEQRAVAAPRVDVDERGVVAEDREPAQLRGRRSGLVRRLRRGAAKAGPAQAGGQQVVADAVVGRPCDLAEVRRLHTGWGLRRLDGRGAGGEQYQGERDAGPVHERRHRCATLRSRPVGGHLRWDGP